MLKMLIFYEKMKKYVIMYANEGANGSRVCTADLDTMLMNIENRNKGEALWNPLIF